MDEQVKSKLIQIPLNSSPVDTMTLQVIAGHHPHGDQSQAIHIKVAKALEFKEECYSRRLTIGEEWQQLEFGWVEHPGVLIIENRAGKSSLVNPTEDEKIVIKQSILEIALGAKTDTATIGKGWPISPLMPFVSEVNSDADIFIRSQKGKIPIGLTVIPR